MALTPVSPASAFELTHSSVKPRKAYFDGAPVRIALRFQADEPTDLTLTIRRGGWLLKRLQIPGAEPGRVLRRSWHGVTGAGKAAPDGGYKVFAKPSGRRPVLLGRFRLRGYVFPVRARHGTRGGIGRYGAPRSGGRRHEGFDVVAPCGSKLVAARGGRVVRRGYDPVLYGHYLTIKARKTRRQLFYSHLLKPATVKLRARVRTGQRVGEVGQTGNARTTPCHLHFEIHRRGRSIDPEPWLRRWDRYS